MKRLRWALDCVWSYLLFDLRLVSPLLWVTSQFADSVTLATVLEHQRRNGGIDGRATGDVFQVMVRYVDAAARLRVDIVCAFGFQPENRATKAFGFCRAAGDVQWGTLAGLYFDTPGQVVAQVCAEKSGHNTRWVKLNGSMTKVLETGSIA